MASPSVQVVSLPRLLILTLLPRYEAVWHATSICLKKWAAGRHDFGHADHAAAGTLSITEQIVKPPVIYRIAGFGKPTEPPVRSRLYAVANLRALRDACCNWSRINRANARHLRRDLHLRTLALFPAQVICPGCQRSVTEPVMRTNPIIHRIRGSQFSPERCRSCPVGTELPVKRTEPAIMYP